MIYQPTKTRKAFGTKLYSISFSSRQWQQDCFMYQLVSISQLMNVRHVRCVKCILIARVTLPCKRTETRSIYHKCLSGFSQHVYRFLTLSYKGLWIKVGVWSQNAIKILKADEYKMPPMSLPKWDKLKALTCCEPLWPCLALTQKMKQKRPLLTAKHSAHSRFLFICQRQKRRHAVVGVQFYFI